MLNIEPLAPLSRNYSGFQSGMYTCSLTVPEHLSYDKKGTAFMFTKIVALKCSEHILSGTDLFLNFPYQSAVFINNAYKSCI